MVSIEMNINVYFMDYKDDNIQSLKNAYDRVQSNLEKIRNSKKNYICTCALRTMHVEIEFDETEIVAYVDDIDPDKLCCNCCYSVTQLPNSACGEGFLDHFHPNFTEALEIASLDIIGSAILALEYGLKELTDDEIDTLCRENPGVDLASAKEFNSYFNDLEL